MRNGNAAQAFSAVRGGAAFASERKRSVRNAGPVSYTHLEGIAIDDLVALPARERIGRFKYTPIENVDAAYEDTRRALAKEIADLHQKEDF